MIMVNIRDQVTHQTSVIIELKKHLQSIKVFDSQVKTMVESVPTGKKPTKALLSKIGSAVESFTTESTIAVKTVLDKTPNSGESSGSGYVASRVMNKMITKNSPIKYLTKVFSRSKSDADPKSRDRPENDTPQPEGRRTKRASTWFDKFASPKRRKINTIIHDMEKEIIDNTLPPAGKIEFSPLSYLRMITGIPKAFKSKARELCVEAGFVPVGERNLRKVEQGVRQGKLPKSSWKQRGRPAIIDIEDLREELLIRQRQNPGVALDFVDMSELLLEHMNAALESAGFQPLSVDGPSDQSVKNYLDVAAIFDDGLRVNRAKTKNSSRRKKKIHCDLPYPMH